MNRSERRLYEQLFDAFADPASQREMLIAAIDCFAEKGFHATTTRDIAKAAQMSPAALYVHFKDKHEVLFRIVSIVATAVYDRLQEAASSPGTPTERFRRIVHAHVRAHTEMHTAVKVVNFEFGSLPQQHRQSVLELRDKTEELYSRCLAEGIERGEFNIRDVHIAELAVYSLAAAVSQWYRPEGKYSPDELADLYMDLATGMVTHPNALIASSAKRAPRRPAPPKRRRAAASGATDYATTDSET